MNILSYIRKGIDKIFIQIGKTVPFFYTKGGPKNTLLCNRDNFYRCDQGGSEIAFTQIKIDHKFVNGMHGFKLIKRPDLDFYSLYISEYGAKEQKMLYEIKGYYDVSDNLVT